VTGLTKTEGTVDGVTGDVLEASNTARGEKSSRAASGEFALRAQAIIVTSGGIGGNHALVRKHWPKRLGEPPRQMLSGVPDYVDGMMQGVVSASGGNIINADRMWHYPEGIENYASVWPNHGIRILSGPSPLWLDARGRRLPVPLFPGFDSFGALAHITRQGDDHSWFLLNERIIGREFALSGSEQNPDLTEKSIKLVLGRVGKGAPAPVRRFVDRGADFVTAKTLPELVASMNRIGGNQIDAAELEREVVARDLQMDNTFGKDAQVMAIRAARRYLGDKLIRVAKPHKILDPDAGPLIAVKLHVLTRKTLGGLETDLSSRVLQPGGEPLPGVYAAGEVAGFGGGGMHGYRALEGTFLGGCIFSGRTAGREAAKAIK
jgi:predicted oxidoreductase